MSTSNSLDLNDGNERQSNVRTKLLPNPTATTTTTTAAAAAGADGERNGSSLSSAKLPPLQNYLQTSSRRSLRDSKRDSKRRYSLDSSYSLLRQTDEKFEYGEQDYATFHTLRRDRKPWAYPSKERDSIEFISEKHLKDFIGDEAKRRKQLWLECFFSPAERNDMNDLYFRKYSEQFERVSQSCEGCARTLFTHVHTYGAEFLNVSETLDELTGETQAKQKMIDALFQFYPLSETSGISAALRILIVLEYELAIDFAPSIPDLVCILLCYLKEHEAFYAVKKIIEKAERKWIALPSKPRRESGTRRRMISCDFESSLSVALTFTEGIWKKAFPGIEVSHSAIQTWLDRLLVPILNTTQIFQVFDEIFAGKNDLKLFYRIIFNALRATNALRETHTLNTEEEEMTILIRSKLMSKPNIVSFAYEVPFSPRKRLRYAFLFKREYLNKVTKNIQSLLVGRHKKINPIPHVSRIAFMGSKTIGTFTAASRLVKWLPATERSNSRRLKRIFESGTGLHRDIQQDRLNLDDLLRACGGENVGACLFVIKIQQQISDLHELDGEEDSLDNQFSICGAYSSNPFVLNFNRHGENSHSGDEASYVFRLTPAKQAKAWRCVKDLSKFPVHDHLYLNVSKTALWFSTVVKSQAGAGGDSILLERQLSNNRLDEKKMENGFYVDEENKRVEEEDVASEVLIGPALWVDHSLTFGHTGNSITYGNEPLCSFGEEKKVDPNKHYYFKIDQCEVFALPKF